MASDIKQSHLVAAPAAESYICSSISGSRWLSNTFNTRAHAPDTGGGGKADPEILKSS